jgi:hypothetical protein
VAVWNVHRPCMLGWASAVFEATHFNTYIGSVWLLSQRLISGPPTTNRTTPNRVQWGPKETWWLKVTQTVLLLLKIKAWEHVGLMFSSLPPTVFSWIFTCLLVSPISMALWKEHFIESKGVEFLVYYDLKQSSDTCPSHKTFFFFLTVLELELSLMLARQVLYHLSHSTSPATLTDKVDIKISAYHSELLIRNHWGIGKDYNIVLLQF